MSSPEAAEVLTTGSAARRCGVKADTVLKWVRSGRIPATRTPGGHYRIDPRELDVFVVSETGKGDHLSPASLRCWEYMSVDGEIPQQCESCLVYESGATRCWAMRNRLEDRYGVHAIPCDIDCAHCVMFQRAHDGISRVLVISRNQQVRAMIEGVRDSGYEVRMVESGYDASSALSTFCAALAVVDVEILRQEPTLIRQLLNDHRARGLRVVLAGHAYGRRKASPGIVAQVRMPFNWDEICQIASRFPVHQDAFAVSQRSADSPTAN